MAGTGSLEEILSSCLSPENLRRVQAESALKAACKDAEVLPHLLATVQQSQSPEVQLLAAQTLRKHVPRDWRRLSSQVQDGMKAGIQELLSGERVGTVRRALAMAAAAMARICVPANQWPSLLPWLHGCTQSPSEAQRETALMLICSLIETIGEHMRQHFSTLVQVADAGLKDSSERVRGQALAAVATLVQWVAEEPEVKTFRTLVPSILQMAQAGLAAEDEHVAIEACEIFIDLIEAPAPVLGPTIPDLVRWCLQVATTTGYDLATREMALQVVQWLARYKPRQLAKSGAVKAVMQVICQLCAEPDPPEHDDADQLPAAKFAAQAIDVLALHLPNKLILPDALNFAQEAIGSPEAHVRAAACTVIVDVAEGCSDALRKKLLPVLQIVGKGFQDPDKKVRGQAMFALGELAAHCQPEMSKHAGEALPHVFAAMAEDDATLQEQACYALDSFCENLEEEMTQYLRPLLERLAGILNSSPSVELQAGALSAISSSAAAAGPGFTPYARDALALLRGFMDITDEEKLRCRVRATEAVGVIAASVGMEVLGPSLQDFVAAALRGLQIEDSELREFTHGMLGSIADKLGKDFAPFLPHAVEAAFASCSQEDGTAGDDSEEEGSAEAKSESLGSDIDDDEEDEDDEEGASRRLNVRTGILDEKAAAAQALGLYAKGTLELYGPYVERTLSILQRMASYFHDDVREQAYDSLAYLVAATAKAFPTSAPGKVSGEVQHVLDAAMAILLHAVEADDDKEAVSVAIAGAVGLVRGLGAEPCAAYLEKLISNITKVASGEALCQLAEEDEEEMEEEEEQEENPDENLLVAVGDALPALAAALGPDTYAPIFAQQHAEALFKWMRGSQPDSVRAAGMGALAEVSRELGHHMVPYVPKLLPIILRELRCEMSDNRRNSAFAAGTLVSAAPEATSQHALNLLQALQPLFQADEEPGTRDNAAGAVSRMILALGSHLPLEQVVPVLLSAVPLKEDLDEVAPVSSALAAMLINPDLAPRLAPQKNSLLQALDAILKQREVPEDLKKTLVEILATSDDPQMQQLLSSLQGHL
ncbi:g7478 [Coccomyxa viridis]|uniref:G7478 protein n=1 Tax=Coccomyxa viridis TaxID=1274662 RepID=A0ABP1G211_9CHLO